jgi:hypothetical protein
MDTDSKNQRPGPIRVHPCSSVVKSPLAQWLAANQCERKRRYADKRDAQTALNSFSKFRGRHGRPEQLRAYHCALCGGWHLTKKV